MLTKLFLTQLHILQLEGYQFTRFLSWWLKHPFQNFTTSKKPLVRTNKVNLIINLSLLSLVITSLFFFFIQPLFIVFPLLLFLLTPFIFQFLALALLKPYELVNKQQTINRTRNSILSQKSLITIGVTGSYGKTSTKDILFNILKDYQPSLKTPESYNTIFGIAKTISLELLPKTKYFICEMAAYHQGEIKQLCYQTPPQFSILTAIGPQHMERFGSIRNTISAKFELLDATKDKQNCLVNLDNPYIQKHIQKPLYKKVQTYSLTDPKSNFYISKPNSDKNGISFTLVYQKHSYSFQSPLFGTANIYNLAAAISMAIILKVPIKNIQETIKNIPASPHRLQLIKLNKATIIDNAFSSNVDGFSLLLKDLKKLPGKKVLFTPGIIELGNNTYSVHQNLGQQAHNIFKKIYLVGHSNRTLGFQKGIKQKVEFIENHTPLWPIITKLSSQYDWILIENDLPDNF